MPSAPELKARLRGEIRARVAGLTPAQRSAAEGQARALLAAQTAWRQARSVFFFAPMPDELDLWPLLLDGLAAGKSVALPHYEQQARAYAAFPIRHPVADVQVGQFGIREPKVAPGAQPLTSLDLLLVPGVAFDTSGARLGRGKGFYDRLLQTVQGVKCGVAFDEQVVECIPHEPHDVHVDFLLTPTRWIDVAA